MSQHDTLTLEQAVFTVLEGFTLPQGVRKVLEAAYYNRAALSATQPDQAAQSADERAMLEMIDERDRCHEWADQLASAIAEHTCHEIGEHTSANNPWRMALNALECHERQDTTHEAGARIKDLEAQAAQGEPVHEMVQLSGRIKELITAHGTLRAASRSLGIDVGYLSRLERGEKVSPSPEVLAKLGLRDAGVRYERLRASSAEAQGVGEVENVPLAWQTTRDGLLAYVLQDDLHNRLTPRVIDIAYTAFMSGARGRNAEDGGQCDWFNDTKPAIEKAITKLRKDLFEASNAPTQPAAGADVLDAERYRWLRDQHQGQTEQAYDAEGFPLPQEPTAIACTVFKPGRDLCLEPISCTPGELDAHIDAAIAASGRQE